MYVIRDKKFVFLAAPRTGSKAVAKALLEQRGAILIGSHPTTPEDHPEYEIGKDWTVCSTIRNHWDAMISWYFKIERLENAMTPLIKFLPHFCANNPSFVRDRKLWWKTTTQSNTVLRHEWLQADLDVALVKAGMAPAELTPVFDSKRIGTPYQVCYKRPERLWVQDYFADEIERYGYKF